MTRKMLLAPALALTVLASATPARAQSAQPSQGMTISNGPIDYLIGLLLPAVQAAREAARRSK